MSDFPDELEVDAWHGLLRAQARLWKALEVSLEDRHDLSLHAYDVLASIDDAPAGRRRMAELSGAVRMSTGGFTRLADRLEQRGLIRRERCVSDARGYEAVLTDDGRGALLRARRTHRSDIRVQILGRLSADERATLVALWTRLHGAEG